MDTGPEALSAADKKRVGLLEGREDLFDTRLLALTPEKSGTDVLVLSRDPGSAAALLPVVTLLEKREGVHLSLAADGRAKEAFLKAFPNAEDRTPPDTVLGLSSLPHPDVILTDVSSSERGLELQAAALYEATPLVLIEDFYTTAVPYLRALKERGLPLPAAICVMDEAARAIIQERMPELAERISITGQPAFDRFAKEDTAEIRSRVRKTLALEPGKKLVTYMGVSTGAREEIEAVCAGLKKGGEDFVMIYRKHPRDTTPEEDYAAILDAAGIHRANVPEGTTTDELSAASDVIITNWSTEGLNAAYRRIPVLYINDASLTTPPNDISYPLPQVTLGAGAAVYDVADVPDTFASMLDTSSEMNARMREAMETHYRADGKNAERVLDVLDTVLKRS